MNALKFLTKSFSFKLGNVDLNPAYWQAAAIVFLLFLLVLTLARLRYLYLHWSLGKSSLAMIFWGFLLALVVEGFFLIGGRTLFTEILGWENAPKPISTALDVSREKLVQVLGISQEIPNSVAQSIPTTQSVLIDYQTLSEEDAEQLRLMICTP